MRKILTSVLAILLAVTLLSCGQASPEEMVYVENVGMICGIGAVGMTNRFAGVIVSNSETKIEKTDAKIAEMLVKAGDDVKEGDTLFTYDSEALEFALTQAELELERQQLNVASLQEDISRLETEKAKAKEDQQLAYSLEIREAEAKLLEEQYNIKLKEQEIAKSTEALENTVVVSPVTGRVQAINEDGAYDDNGMPLPFISIVEEGTYRCMGYVSEMNMASLYEGVRVILRSRVDDSVWYGAVSGIDLENASSGSQNMYVYYDGMDETGSSSRYPFYVTLDDVTGLMLGQHVYIEIDDGMGEADDDALRLPAYYIADDDGDAYVFAEGKDGKLEKRQLTLGGFDEITACWIVEKGLSAKDNIAFPTEDLKEGMTCTTEYIPPEEGEMMPEDMMFEEGGMEEMMPEDMMYEEGGMEEMMPEDMMYEEDGMEEMMPEDMMYEEDGMEETAPEDMMLPEETDSDEQTEE